MNANALLAQVTCNLHVKNLALEARIKELDSENKNLVNKLKAVWDLAAAKEHHLTEMVRQARQRLSYTENNMAALIRTMAPFKQRQDQILAEIKNLTKTVSSSSPQLRPDHSAGGLYDRQAVGPIISLPPQAPGIMPGAVSTDNNIVADQPQRAGSLQDAGDVGPAVAVSDGRTERKVVRQSVLIGPAVAVSDGRTERKVVLTQTHKRQQERQLLKRALSNQPFVCLQAQDKSSAEDKRTVSVASETDKHHNLEKKDEIPGTVTRKR